MTRDRATADLFGAPPQAMADDAPTGAVTLTVARHHETPARGINPGALLVSLTGDEQRAVWVPKRSDVRFSERNSVITGRRGDGTAVKLRLIEMALPELLAIEKGLL